MVPRVRAILKQDALGRVELLEDGSQLRIRRVACGGRVPGSRLLAHALMRRERAALAVLEGLEGVPWLERDSAWAHAAGADGRAPLARDVLVRSFQRGRGLHEAETLPTDFFARLAELVERVHGRGVCHNDLHKEQNVVVGEDGWPALVDFQLASVHRAAGADGPAPGRRFRARCGDDLRHVSKHLRRYARRGGPKTDALPALSRRSFSASTWRRVVKPVYNAVTRRFDWKDGEPRRASSGPWPAWTAPLREGAQPSEGPRAGS